MPRQYNTNRIRRSRHLWSLLPLVMLLFCSVSCEKEVLRYDELSQFHTESLQLASVPADSVNRFAQKVAAFVAAHPDAEDDPLYPAIQQIIQQNLRIRIIIDDEWDGEIHVNF